MHVSAIHDAGAPHSDAARFNCITTSRIGVRRSNRVMVAKLGVPVGGYDAWYGGLTNRDFLVFLFRQK